MHKLPALIFLSFFIQSKALCQSRLPFEPNQIQLDNERDSLYHYTGASKVYVVAARPPRDPNYNKGKLIVDKRGIGQMYNLWTNVSDYSVKEHLGIKDLQNRVYWLDNKAHTLSMYRNDSLIWKNNVQLATFCGGRGVVHHLQLRHQLIYVWDGCGWAGYDRNNGKELDGGND